MTKKAHPQDMNVMAKMIVDAATGSDNGNQKKSIPVKKQKSTIKKNKKSQQ
jgi:hypothetical protein